MKLPLTSKVATDALDHLEVDAVDRCPARNEVFRSLLIAQSKLKPFIPAQVIGNPCLAALVLASYPVAEQLAFVRVALPPDRLVVHDVTTLTGRDGGVGGGGFDTHVQLWTARHMRKAQARSDGGAAGSVDGGNVIMNFRVRVKGEPIADKWEPVGEIKTAKAGASVLKAKFDRTIRSREAEETSQERMKGDWLVALASPDTVRSNPNKAQMLGSTTRSMPRRTG